MSRKLYPPRDPDRYFEAGMGKITDEEVGQKLGVSKERVEYVRAALGVAASGEHGKTRIGRAAADHAAERYRKRDLRIRDLWRKHRVVHKVAQLVHASDRAVQRALRRMGIEPRPSVQRIDWAAANWAQSDTEIAAELNTSPNYVSRKRKRLRAQGKRV